MFSRCFAAGSRLDFIYVKGWFQAWTTVCMKVIFIINVSLNNINWCMHGYSTNKVQFGAVYSVIIINTDIRQKFSNWWEHRSLQTLCTQEGYWHSYLVMTFSVISQNIDFYIKSITECNWFARLCWQIRLAICNDDFCESFRK